MKKLNSPLAWVGGKSRLRDSIIPLIPEHHCYVEVFAGAGWVYFGKAPSKVEVLNDVNGDLVNLYRVLQKQPEAFYEALWYMFPSRQLHKMSKDLLENSDGILTEVERAVLFYYQIRNAFGARYGASYAVTQSRPPKQMIGMDTLIAVQERLRSTHVEQLSFERLIKIYDKPDTFFYCDPPYTNADGEHHYQFTFNEEKHRALRDLLAGANAKWLLSYDDVPTIHHLYRDYKISKTKDIPYTLNNRTGKTPRKHELLISNY